MAAISAGGIGSGLDVPTLVQQLVAAERGATDNRLNSAQSQAKSQLSAFGLLQGSIDGLKTALASLRDGTPFDAFTSTSSATDILTAQASKGAVAGTYQIEVLALASAHKLRSTGFVAGTAFGAGQLSISAGGQTITATVAANASLVDVRDAINTASAGKGVTASVVNADDGAHLVLSATGLGSAGALRVTRSGDASLDAFVFDPGTQTVLSEQTPATDASVKIDGLAVTSSSNRISTALPGVNIDLKSAKPGQVNTLTIARDSSAVSKAVQSLVNSYNAAISVMRSVTRFDPATRQASALTGDALVRGAEGQLRTAVSSTLADAGLAGMKAGALGISTKIDGSLNFDASKLEATLATDPVAVQSAFSGAQGLAARLNGVITTLTGTDGPLTSRNTSLNKRLKDIDDQRATLDRRMESLKTRYLAQFTALDSLVAKMQNTSSFLSQQLTQNSSNA